MNTSPEDTVAGASISIGPPSDHHGPLVLVANLVGALVIAALVAWLIAVYAGQPGPRPAHGPARGAIPTSTGAYGA